jgi:hypothetical protein
MPEADSPKSETDGEEQINEKNKEIERLTNVVESTKTELNAARERLGMPPITEDPPSVAAEKKNLDALKKEQEDLAREMEEIRQKEKERLIREEKEKILQEKIDELFIELDALNADDLKSILGNGRMKDGKSLESRSMGTLDDVTAKDLAKAFAEGIKLLPKILELLPELMKQFDAELEKQAKERVEKKLKEEEEKKEVEKKKGVATETPEQPPTPIISEASQVAEQVGEAGTK